MTETTARIRWEPTEYAGLGGFVGAGKSWLFQIWPTGKDGWQLDSTLPGQFDRHPVSSDPGKLKAKAERFLAEFVSSLGAIFGDDLRGAVKRERDTRNDVAADLTEVGRFDQAERCWGWTDALDWVTSAMDRMTPETSAPRAGEKETTDG